MTDFKYDVAISLVKEDVGVGQELHDLLRSSINSIFFYPESQRDLIGQDGVEKFGNVFRRESRVVVVIHRKEWGTTPWTGVEENAIKEMCWNEGWDRIIVHSVDGSAPTWLPKIHIWSGGRFGLTALAAAIEQKVKDVGGQVGEEDVVAKANRVRRALAAQEAREERRGTDEAVRAARNEYALINARLEQLVKESEPTYEGLKITEPGPDSIHGEVVDGCYRVWAGNGLGNAAIFFKWTGNTVNSIRGDKLVLCSGSLGDWQRLGEVREVVSWELELAEDNFTWRWVDGKGRQFTSSQVAEFALRWLLDEHEKRRKVEFQRRRR